MRDLSRNEEGTHASREKRRVHVERATVPLDGWHGTGPRHGGPPGTYQRVERDRNEMRTRVVRGGQDTAVEVLGRSGKRGRVGGVQRSSSRTFGGPSLGASVTVHTSHHVGVSAETGSKEDEVLGPFGEYETHGTKG